MDTILCPNCNQSIEISQAIRHHIEEEVISAEKNKHKIELEQLDRKIRDEERKKLTEEIDFKLKDKENQLEETKLQNKALRDQLLDLNKSIRQLQESEDKRALENEKRLQQERLNIKQEAMKQEEEKSQLVISELKKQLEDQKKLLVDAQRKMNQGSQQLQGEILELELESRLRSTFLYDEILPVPKGVEGADILHKVYYKPEVYSGSIVWELKRTKTWNKDWLAKLREDARKLGTSTAVLVSEVLPDSITHFGLLDRVWVCSFEYAIPLASVLRVNLVQVTHAKATAENKDKKLESLYTYLTNDVFRGRFESLVESIVELQVDAEAEKRALQRLWKKKEIQLNRLINNTSFMYGELQGILGSALPTIRGLDNPQIESGDYDESKTD